MEQTPNNTEKEKAPKRSGEVYETERGPDGTWRVLQEQAPEQAKELVAQIEGFEQLPAAERVTALQALMTELATDKDNQDNRFVVEELAKLARAIEARAAYEKVKSSLDAPIGNLVNELA